ncbi:MAG TPA: hypothetical protein VGG34_02920 [Opitutaceae bacterium]|jgi:hypothetical protein
MSPEFESGMSAAIRPADFAGRVWARLRGDKLAVSALWVRFANLLQGALIAAAVVAFLTPKEQGVWYSFLAVLGIAGYAELGFGSAAMQVVAHDAGGGSGSAAKRHAYFLITLRFACVAAVLYTILLVIAGILVFGARGDAHDGSYLPLFMAAAATGGVLFLLAPINSFFEGCQWIVQSNLRRAVQSAAYGVGAVAGLALGFKVWGVVTGYALAGVLVILLLLKQHGRFLLELFGAPKEVDVSWRRDFWPLQRRYAVTWLSGILYLSAMNPLIFRLSGATEAGRFGLTWSLLQTVAAFSGIWLNSRAAVYASQVGGGRHREFRHDYWRSFRWSVTSYCFGALALLGGVAMGAQFWPRVASRFLPIPALALLLMGAGLIFLLQSLGTFLRSFREEPLMKEAWLSSVLILGLAVLFVPRWGGEGAAAALVASQLVMVPFYLRKVRIYSRRLSPA